MSLHSDSSFLSVSSVPLSRSVQARIAGMYVSSAPQPVPEIAHIEQVIRAEFRALPMPVEFVDHDPYRGLWGLQAGVEGTGLLAITTRHNEAVLPPITNLQFRAVHDADHLARGLNFAVYGEVMAAKVWCARQGDDAMQAFLFSEIVAQACAAVVFGQFAPQKYVRFPRRFRDEVLRSV